jgi:hypothetical protein
MKSGRFETLLIVLGVWIVLVGLALLYSWHFPKTALGWVITLGFAPILLIALELLGEFVVHFVGKLPGNRHVGPRVKLVVGLLMVVPICGILVWLQDGSSSSFVRGIKEWTNRNFY